MKALLLAPLFCVACGTIDPVPECAPSASVDNMVSRALAVYASAGHPLQTDYAIGVGTLPDPTMLAACVTWRRGLEAGKKVVVSRRMLDADQDLQTYVMIHEIAHCSFGLAHVKQEQGQIMSPFAPDWANPLDTDAWAVFWEQIQQAELVKFAGI